jgi:Zn-dependent peptidase ImmA (M78 family)
MNFSRMDLADCATPDTLLSTIHQLQEGVFPIPIPVEAWAAELDIVAIEAMETEGFEGGLMMFADRSSASILVNKANDERRQRFTIGHELGHFLLPWHTPRSGQAFQCSKKDMGTFVASAADSKYMRMEAQANEFSAGFLMPAVPFRVDLRARRDFEVTHIIELADRYQTSREATARRCVDLFEEPLAIVISNGGVILRTYPKKGFPWLCVARNQAVPPASHTARSRLAPGQCSSWGETPAHVWLENARGTVFEQCLAQHDDFRLTLLTFEADVVDADDEDEEEVERAWRPPTFSRR